MKRLVVVEPEAEADLAQAVAWYEQQRPGLGGQLFDEVYDTLARLESKPEPSVSDPTDKRARRVFVQRFPFAVVFHRKGRTLLVIAIAHLRRRPGYWGEKRRR